MVSKVEILRNHDFQKIMISLCCLWNWRIHRWWINYSSMNNSSIIDGYNWNWITKSIFLRKSISLSMNWFIDDGVFIIEINEIHLIDGFIIEINAIHLTDVFIDDDLFISKINLIDFNNEFIIDELIHHRWKHQWDESHRFQWWIHCRWTVDEWAAGSSARTYGMCSRAELSAAN